MITFESKCDEFKSCMSLEVFYEKIIRIEIKLNRSNFNKFENE